MIVLLLAALAAPRQVPIVPESWLVLAPVDRRGRRPFRPDAVFGRYLLDPDADAPVEGEAVTGETGEESWTRVEPDADGNLAGRAGYAFALVEPPSRGVYLAELQGASQLFVNGEGFVGDGYRYGYAGVPVLLEEGDNSVFVTGIRGGFRLRFVPHEGASVAQPRAAVLPDAGSGDRIHGATAHLVSTTDPGARPLSSLFTSRAPDDSPADEELEGALHRHVFLSGIDDSVQEYAVLPPEVDGDRLAVTKVIVSLHGASVGLMNQARAHSRHPDFWVLVPTNRRPFGFDWQDWGRRDAYEVMEDFRRRHFPVGVRDELRWYLVGHSMGGHGVWTLAANDLDRFEAIAPSAGWQSFDTYGGRPNGSRSDLWHAADRESRTLDLLSNLVQLPTFVLHGADDRTVPMAEAEGMVALLRGAGAEPSTHWQESAGHWWDGDRARGADCLEWPELVDSFRAAPERPREPSEVDWTTVGPGVDADHRYLHLDQPLVYGEPVRIHATWDAVEGRLSVSPENVRRFSVVDLPVSRLDVGGRELALPGQERVRIDLLFDGDAWRIDGDASWRSREKHAGATGPFKRAFDHGFVLVYGTGGDEGETRELLARARHDQQVWWYRANGVAPLLSDHELLAGRHVGRNVILYGNEDTNRAWKRVLGQTPPVRAKRGSITSGGFRTEDAAAACVFVAPRIDSPGNLVGVFADAGISGTRLGYTFAPFVSGVGYPDLAAVSGDVLQRGDDAVVFAGWSGHDWSGASPNED